jgi:hypothetical protein
MINSETLSSPGARPAKLLLVFFMFLAAPMPLMLIFCVGLLPPAVQFIITVRLMLGGDLFFLAFGIHVLIAAALGYFIAHLLVTRLATANRRINIALVAGAGLFILLPAFFPVYYFDCMDGRGPASCNALDIYTVLFVNDHRCGDF